jgi:uncharacterized protein YndB with AHSA1/START domain/DNA-binding transcriptional ArsR family regulator
MDAIFRALSDPSRRRLLDKLNERNGQTLRELCSGLEMARQSVSKHLSVLESAGVITTTRRGRERLHYLNVAPINDIAERWISKYDRARVHAVADLKHALEDASMERTGFTYVTYIHTTPETLWRALTDPSFTMRYWGMALASDWKVGSPILVQWAPGEPFREAGQVVLEADPYRRLSYRWHTLQPEHANILGWSEETFSAALEEPLSTVSFDLEPAGGTVKLTVVHDGFPPDSPILASICNGWPQILSNLKTLLETDAILPLPTR